MTDFIQMIVLVIGMSIIAVFASDLAGGAARSSHGNVAGPVQPLPEPSFTDITFFVAAGLTMMLGASRSRTSSSA